MFDIDHWREIWATLSQNRLRTFLTAFGVFWGILSIVFMLGMGRAFESGIANKMRGFANNTIYIWGNRTSLPYKGLQPGRLIRYKNGDIQALRDGISGLEYLAPRNQLGNFRRSTQVVAGGKSGSYEILGDYPEFKLIQPITITHGRFINHYDIEEHRKIAVIGSQVATDLFGDLSPIGKSLRISGVYFQVAGLFTTRQRGSRGARAEQTIHIPFSSMQQTFNYGDRVGWFAATARTGVSAAKVEQQIRKILAERHKISPEDSEGIGSWNAGKRFEKQRQLFVLINLVIWVVGILTLFAGIFGVSNVMLITVKERTQEFGLRKAIGARPRTIVLTLVYECMALTSLAGYLGFLAGFGVIQLLNSTLSQAKAEILTHLGSLEIDFNIALFALGALITAGLIAAIIPALHAARISPVEALRAE